MRLRDPKTLINANKIALDVDDERFSLGLLSTKRGSSCKIQSIHQNLTKHQMDYAGPKPIDFGIIKYQKKK